MSKLIVEMKMPKDCYDCPMYDFASYRGKLTLCCNAHLDLKPIPNNGNPRPSWCPIIGVLPEQHGRLVDADACSPVLRKLENEAKTNTEKLCYGFAAKMFEEAFTIVAAERSET